MDNILQENTLGSGELRTGLILKPAEDDHWIVGSGKAGMRFGAKDLNSSGDWTPWKPDDEAQSRTNFDTNACAVFATLKAWIVLAKYYGFTDFPTNVSERYSGVECGTTPYGTDPHQVGEVTRTVAGVIPQALMPWTDDIDSWNEYYNRSMAHSLVPYGQKILQTFTLGHEWVFPWGSNYTPEQKKNMLKAALKRGPVCVSVSGAYVRDGNGCLTKPAGATDSHWVLLLRFDGDNGVFHDQYGPFLETLDANYDHNAAKLYFLKREPSLTPKNDFWSVIWAGFAKLKIWG